MKCYYILKYPFINMTKLIEIHLFVIKYKLLSLRFPHNRISKKNDLLLFTNSVHNSKLLSIPSKN